MGQGGSRIEKWMRSYSVHQQVNVENWYNMQAHIFIYFLSKIWSRKILSNEYIQLIPLVRSTDDTQGSCFQATKFLSLDQRLQILIIWYL